MSDYIDDLQVSCCTSCGAKLPPDCGFSDLCERCEDIAFRKQQEEQTKATEERQ
ncbi:MAG: hypothetical protein JSS75_07410 [Bacteroidetes bacterium]|nr:hypothetical protein [Bacteroidota bacterium]